MNAAASTQWREPSLLDLTGPAGQAFMGIVESIPPGRRFTVNDLRDRLDAAGIPNTQRGGLFYAAIAAGLIEPVRVAAWGVDYDVRVHSTGGTAKRAPVRVYRRLGAPTHGEGDRP